MPVRSLFAGLAAVLNLAVVMPAAADTPERTPALETALREVAGGTELVWVFFRDKGPDPQARLAEARAALSQRALVRRALRGEITGVTFEDVPLERSYVDAVAARVTRVRHEVPWVNAVSVQATAAQVDTLAALPFVGRLDIVRRYRGRPEEPLAARRSSPAEPMPWPQPTIPAPVTAVGVLDYGTALNQVQQIGVPALHRLGLNGEGVVVAVFDTGFDTLSHEVFSDMRIAARRDFVNGDDDVADGRDMGEGSHGTETLSVIGGFRSGSLIGPAYGATFFLAKTENTVSETPVEEDNWSAAAQWAEARGADVISSSLGYLDFDAPHRSYTFTDMNGQTAISTRAADLAASRGIVVVNSAGNSGFNATRNTLGAPADGRLVLAIAAVDSSGARVSFSSVGPSADGRTKPDLAAQGQGVVAARPDSASGYTLVSGTSFSCPLTAGVVALLVQARPSASVAQISDALRRTASRGSSPDNLVGWGIVNGPAALGALQASAP